LREEINNYFNSNRGGLKTFTSCLVLNNVQFNDAQNDQ